MRDDKPGFGEDFREGFYVGEPLHEYQECAECKTRFRFLGDKPTEFCAGCAGRPLAALTPRMIVRNEEAMQAAMLEAIAEDERRTQGQPARVVAMRRGR